MRERNIDSSLIFSLDTIPNTSLVYLTGYTGIGTLLVESSGKSELIVPLMEYEKACKTNLNVKISSKKLTPFKHKKVFGIEEKKITLNLFKKLQKEYKETKFVDISSILENMRITKKTEEIKNIKKACRINDKILNEIKKNFKFNKEKELAHFIERRIKENNGNLAFEPIVASGISSSMPHYSGNKKIGKGFLLIDMGAKYNGYCSDITRMFYMGKPNEEEKENFELVLKAVNLAKKYAQSKSHFKDINDACAIIFKEKLQFFVHSIGHGIGLDIHEKPFLNKQSQVKIKEMIPFTIEPGLYFPRKYGIRLEDTCLKTKTGIEALTKFPKTLHFI